MSYWTNIRGMIVIRCLHLRENQIKGQLEELMGRCIWDNEEDEDWKRCTVPKGSEGSLFYWYHDVDDSITINGNLRDFGEEESEIESVVEWFRGCLLKVRELQIGGVDSAIIQIQRSRHPTQCWSWVPKDEFRFEHHLVRLVDCGPPKKLMPLPLDPEFLKELPLDEEE
jgi:hypothetical protein